MDKAALLALADRVEAMTGPDRGVDAAIVLAICRGATVGHYAADDDGDIVFHAAAIGIRDKSTCPHFTASLDAAMTLVPEGVCGEKRFLQLTIAPLGCDIVEYRCEIIDTIGGQKSCSKALTEACAITAAALRAIAGGEDAN